MNEYLLVLTSVPEKEEGEKIATALVEDRLAACVTMSASGQSFYWWQGKISNDEEYMLYIKTKAELYPEVEKKILKVHSYELPEIISLPIHNGYGKYLNWLNEECTCK